MIENIDEIIRQDVQQVDVDRIELPASMREQEGTAEGAAEEGAEQQQTMTMSLEELSRLIIEGYNIVSCVVYRKIDSEYDASLTSDEKDAINEPLKLVLKQYNVQMTPVTALCCTLIAINVGKVVDMKMQQKERLQHYNEVNMPENGSERA